MNFVTVIITILSTVCAALFYLALPWLRRKERPETPGRGFVVEAAKHIVVFDFVGCIIMILVIAIVAEDHGAMVLVLQGFRYGNRLGVRGLMVIGAAIFFYLIPATEIIKELPFKVVVEGKKVTLFSFLKKSETFMIDDIVSAKCTIDKNLAHLPYGKETRIVVRIASGTVIKIYRYKHLSFDKFLGTIQSKIK